jgi:TIR domain
MATKPTGPLAAIVNAAGGVRLWPYGGPPGSFIGSSAEIAGRDLVAVALSEDLGLKVLSAAGDYISLDEAALGGELRRTEVRRCELVRDAGQLVGLALSPSGSIAVLACADGTLRGFSTGTWAPVWTLRPGHPSRAVALASDAGPVLAATTDGRISRHDLDAGSSDITGPGPAVRAVAVTSDATVVVAGYADGTLLRWSSRTGDVRQRTWRIAAAITAVAIGAGGDQVLAAADDGRVRLYDFAAGESFGYDAGESSGSGEVVRGVARARPEPVADPSGLAASRDDAGVASLDEDVRFTVYRPVSLPAQTWETLLVFAHKTSLIERPGGPPIDPNKQVAARARLRFGDTAAPPAAADARYSLRRGAQVRIVPDLPDVQCNPAEATIDWWEPVHEVEFRVWAPQWLTGSVVRGSVRIWYGSLILGEVSVAIPVAVAGEVEPGPPVEHSASRYRKIFPSYSRGDLPLLASFTEAARALGDTYLQDVLALRSGERWEPRLLELIEEADIFQLFWSSNSMRSPYCRYEWEHALTLGRPSFIRPVYWENPLPQDVALGVPPASLRALQFVQVQLYAAARSAEPDAPAPAVAADYEATGAFRSAPSHLPPTQSPPGEPADEATDVRTQAVLSWELPGAVGMARDVDWDALENTLEPAPAYDLRPVARRRAGVSRRTTVVAAVALVAVVIAVLIALHVFG